MSEHNTETVYSCFPDNRGYKNNVKSPRPGNISHLYAEIPPSSHRDKIVLLQVKCYVGLSHCRTRCLVVERHVRYVVVLLHRISSFTQRRRSSVISQSPHYVVNILVLCSSFSFKTAQDWLKGWHLVSSQFFFLSWQTTWFQPGTRSLQGQKEQTAYVRGYLWGYCNKAKNTECAMIFFKKKGGENNNKKHLSVVCRGNCLSSCPAVIRGDKKKLEGTVHGTRAFCLQLRRFFFRIFFFFQLNYLIIQKKRGG